MSELGFDLESALQELDAGGPGSGRHPDLSKIQPEVEYLRQRLSEKQDLFNQAHVVGSWATQNPDRMPDRKGPKTSDIDLMMEPKGAATAGGKNTHWGFAAQLEKDFEKKFGRQLHSNVDRVIGGAPSAQIWKTKDLAELEATALEDLLEELDAGGPGSGCNPDAGKCGRPSSLASNQMAVLKSVQKVWQDKIKEIEPTVVFADSTGVRFLKERDATQLWIAGGKGAFGLGITLYNHNGESTLRIEDSWIPAAWQKSGLFTAGLQKLVDQRDQVKLNDNVRVHFSTNDAAWKAIVKKVGLEWDESSLSAHADGGYPDTGKYDEKKEADRRSNAMFVGYYAENGPTFDADGEYLCGTCKFRLTPDKCTNVGGTISMKTGSCQLYAIGPAAKTEDEQPLKFDQSTVGYTERPNVKAFGCTRCEYGEKAKDKDAANRSLWCRFWGMHVMAPACCMKNEGKDDVHPDEKDEDAELEAAIDDILERVKDKSSGLYASTETPVTGFDDEETKKLHKVIAMIPSHLTRNVKEVYSKRSLDAVHGRYNPSDNRIEYNPDNFKNGTKMGTETLQELYVLTLIHEFGHSVYEGLPQEKKNEWRELSGWQKGQPEGNATPYKEKRPGWEPYTANETPRKDAKFTRKYGSKNANEDFADCFAFYFADNQAQVPEEKRAFIQHLVADKEWKPTETHVDKVLPTKKK